MESYARKSAFYIFFIAICSFLIGAFGVYIWQQASHKASESKQNEQIIGLQSELDKSILDSQDGNVDTKNTNQPNNSSTNTTVYVTYEPGNKFAGKIREEINSKFVEPYEIFYLDKQPQLAAMHIEESPDSNDWQATAIFVDNSYKLVNFGDRSKLQQDWWRPTCTDSCDFSQEFKSRFPQIVSQYQ